MSTFLKGLRMFAAVLCSILLVIAATAYPLYYTLSSFADSKRVTTLVQNVAPTLLPSAEDIGAQLPIEGLDTEAVTQLMRSDTAGEIVDLYTQDVLAAVLDGSDQRNFTAEALKDIVGNNMDEVVTIIREHLPEDSTVTDSDITEKINEAVDTHADTLVESLSEALPITSIAENSSQPLELIRSLLSPWITAAFLLTILFSAALIVLCRLRELRWMKWLAAISLIVGVFTGSTALLSTGVLSLLSGSIPADIAGIAELILGSFRQDLAITAALALVSGIALIVIYTVVKRKRALTPPAKTEEPT